MPACDPESHSERKFTRRLQIWLKDRDEGQAMIEMAISFMVAITLCFWLFELSMLSYTYSVLNEAVHEGVRYAVVHGSDSGNCSGPSKGCGDAAAANVVTAVKNAASVSLHKTSAMIISVDYPESTGCQPPSLVTVSIAYIYIPYVHLPGISNTVNLKAQGRIVY